MSYGARRLSNFTANNENANYRFSSVSKNKPKFLKPRSKSETIKSKRDSRVQVYHLFTIHLSTKEEIQPDNCKTLVPSAKQQNEVQRRSFVKVNRLLTKIFSLIWNIFADGGQLPLEYFLLWPRISE